MLNLSWIFNKWKEKQCRLKENWGYLIDNTWHFIQSIKAKIDEFYCQHRKIIRVDDTKYVYGKWLDLNDGQKILDDVFEVVCKKKDSSTKKIEFENIYVQIVYN